MRKIKNSNLLERELRKLTPVERAALLDAAWAKVNPEYSYRPAKNIREFVKSEYYLNAKEECYETILDVLVEFEQSGKNIAVIEMPPGSGKSYCSSIIASYEVHKLLCLKEPHKTLGLAKGSNIAVMNMSQNGNQAKKVVFGEIKARIDNSFWFNQFARPNPDKQSELEFQKNIFIIPGNSSQTNPFGYNQVVVIIDEAAWWEFSKNADPVKEVEESLEKRLGNRYGKRWVWKIVLITNASYPDRWVETLIKDPKVFGVRKAIWDIKPWLFGTEFVVWKDGEREYRIPKEIEAETQRNPDMVKRDMLSVPSEVISPWLVNKQALKDAISAHENLLDRIGDTLFIAERLRGRHCYAHIDLGITGDAAGLAITYKKDGRVIVAGLLRIQGDPKNPVQFSEIRALLIALRDKGVVFKKVSYDGFQSVDSIQILRGRGFEVATLSVDRSREPYATVKELLYAGKLQLPTCSFEAATDNARTPTEWLIRELSRLEDIKGKVDHPPKGSKDMADAVAGATYWACLSPEATDISKGGGIKLPGTRRTGDDGFNARDVGSIL